MIPKFRGKSIADENKGKWMCGNLIADKTSAYITDGDIDAYEDFISIERWCSIDVNTVGQSTGLKDKNGVEIFEGDVVDYNGRKAIIKWHGSYASFIYRFVDELRKIKSEWNPLYLSYYRFEVVGNIYENPELLND
ncbi:MAG: hypothetical protein HXO88_01585 [Streptococcus intermedius]|uniref:YopX protein domain-containing protein n=1 Tax=Streptococcus intermedius TaxID=1338 RepID=A0A930RCD5_STRIT|nr:hypothetical protein [Streptococcus intermedius]